MKKQPTTLILCTSAIIWTTHASLYDHDAPYDYEKFRDGEWFIGTVAKQINLAGIGIVQEGDPPYFATREEREKYLFRNWPGNIIVRIEQPFIGCVRNQEIRVLERGRMNQVLFPAEEPPIGLLQTDPELYQELLEKWEYFQSYSPTNGARIVIMAKWANYYQDVSLSNWNKTHEEAPIGIIPPEYLPFRPHDPVPTIPPPKNTLYEMRSEKWRWYDTPENQPLTDFFTNILDAVRINRNWTNYYALCRDAMTNTVEEISYGAEGGLGLLIYSSSDEQFQYMLSDPLLPTNIKTNYIEYLKANPWYRYEPYKVLRY